MSRIYWFYATADGRPRYIGQTTKPVDIRVAQHFGEARRGSRTPVATWIRAQTDASLEVRAHILPAAVVPGDRSLFERCWMNQFAEFLHADAGVPQILDYSPIARAVVTFLGAEPNPDR